MTELVRILIYTGGSIILVGSLLWLLSKYQICLQHLPGNNHIISSNFSCILEFGESVVASIFATLLLDIMVRLIAKFA
jgi:hypothetical protein